MSEQYINHLVKAIYELSPAIEKTLLDIVKYIHCTLIIIFLLVIIGIIYKIIMIEKKED
jgi:hypothetical protein